MAAPYPFTDFEIGKYLRFKFFPLKMSDNWKAVVTNHTVDFFFLGLENALTICEFESMLPYIENHSPSTNVLCSLMLTVVVV